MDEQIGVMSGRTIIGKCCYDSLSEKTYRRPVPIFRVNIGDYFQTCHNCGVTLVVGKLGWPELYEKPS